MGQDVAELLGVCGIIPIHPSTNLRLKKLHETRKNMLHKNADQLQGHDNAMDAAFDIIQNLVELFQLRLRHILYKLRGGLYLVDILDVYSRIFEEYNIDDSLLKVEELVRDTPAILIQRSEIITGFKIARTLKENV